MIVWVGWHGASRLAGPAITAAFVPHAPHLALGNIEMDVAPHDVVVATHDTAEALHDLRDRERFIKSLTEAIAWCTDSGSLSEPRTSLRACKPGDLVSPEDQVSQVCINRSLRLPELGRRLPAVTDLCGGRLVAYFPSFNLADGWAETQSKGFLDVHNIPPYDTWIWWVRSVSRVEYADRRTSE